MNTKHGNSRFDPQQLPLEPLRFDDESDDPVAFALTARARRVVAPEALPELTVLPGGEVAHDDPADTRPARARAMRRAGLSLHEIADELGVDELLLRAWTDGVTVRDASRSVRGGDRRRREPHRQSVPRDESRYRLQRASASTAGRQMMHADPRFAFGLGLAAGMVELDHHAVTLTTRRSAVAAQLLGWLETYAELDPMRVRVVLRTAPQVSGDIAAHRWADELGIERDRVATTRWRNAVELDEVEALVRIGDPMIAATVAGWLDVLAGQPETVDLAF